MLFARATELKDEFSRERRHADPPLERRTLAMLFQRPSLRTRVTFEAGMTQLGGHAIYLTEGVVLGGRESVDDVAHNLERFVDGIMARTGPHEVVVELAAQASIPVVNGLTIREHPCQVLADLFTLHERFGDLRGLPLAFVGDGNNVYHSLALMGATLGMEVRISHPPGYGPTSGSSSGRRRSRRPPAAGSSSTPTRGPSSRARPSCTPTPGRRWARRRRRRSGATPSRSTRSTRDLLAVAPDALVMHCLPAHRGEEITSDVMDGPRSIIFDQSENRLHAQKALLVELLADERRDGGRKAT